MRLVDKTVAEKINVVYKRTMEREKAGPAKSREALARSREEQGLQQSDIADRFGVTQATVSHWETGAATPHYSKWGEIAKVYKVPLKRIIAMFTQAAA